MSHRPKYGSVAIFGPDGERKTYPDDMPVFVLLGKDLLAVAGVEGYAEGLERQAARVLLDGVGEEALRLAGLAADVRAFADRLEAWQEANPDDVKFPD